MKKLSLWLVCLIITTFFISCKDDIENMSQGNGGNVNSSSSARITVVGDQHQIALSSAVDLLNQVNNSTNTFWGSNSLENSSALATVAVEVANGSTNATYVNAYVAKLKQILSATDTTNQCIVTGNIQHREGSGVYLALALAYNNANIMSKLSIPEQERLVLTMKATLVACAYVMADYTFDGTARPNNRVDMRGKLLFNSPNYTEGYAGSFLAALSVIGKQNVYTFLKNYDHATFITELNSKSLTRIGTEFNKTFNVTQGPITYDASTTAKKATLIKNYVRNIDDNETAGRLFFKGVSMTSIVNDPINLLAKLNSECFDEISREGQYAGEFGMAAEFNGGDAGGIRDALYYSASGVFNDLYSRFLFGKVGFWTASSQSAVKTEIDRRLKVGFSDINPKAWNGYLSFKIGGYSNERLVRYQTGKGWWQRVHDLANSMGLAQEYFLHDSFGDGNYSTFPKWTAVNGSWTNFPIVESWTGYISTTVTPRPTQDTLISSNVSNAPARLITEYSGSNYNITVQCKVETYGTNGQIGIIGRTNNDGSAISNKNYYLVTYNNATTSWKIDKFTNGVATNLKTFPVSGVAPKQILPGIALTNQVYFLRVHFEGGAIKIYLNNTFITSVSDINALITSGSIGLYTSNTKALFDDVYVNQPLP